MKDYYVQDNIGRAKYTVSYHNGEAKHRDGSNFYSIMIFKNRAKRDKFIKSLVDSGYKEKSA